MKACGCLFSFEQRGELNAGQRPFRVQKAVWESLLHSAGLATHTVLYMQGNRSSEKSCFGNSIQQPLQAMR